MSVDRLIIRDLRARCIIGVNNDERRDKQDVVISLSIYTDLEKAASSDRFEDALDYRCLKKKVLAMVEASTYHLVEALAEAIAEVCLSDEAIRRVDVLVEKPGALRFARSAGVEITREKQE